jgi:hypothetical protein
MEVLPAGRVGVIAFFAPASAELRQHWRREFIEQTQSVLPGPIEQLPAEQRLALAGCSFCQVPRLFILQERFHSFLESYFLTCLVSSGPSASSISRNFVNE